MNLEQATFLAQWDEDLQRIVALGREAAEKAERVSNRGVDGAYRQIALAADRLVQRDARLTHDGAVVRVLRDRPQLYDDYLREFELRQHIESVSDANLQRKI